MFLNFVLQPIKSLLDYRAERESSTCKSGGGAGDPQSEQVPSSSSSNPLTPSVSGSAAATSASHRSVYREILYLTLVSLGQGWR